MLGAEGVSRHTRPPVACNTWESGPKAEEIGEVGYEGGRDGERRRNSQWQSKQNKSWTSY